MSDERQAFEQLHAIPSGAIWCENRDVYIHKNYSGMVLHPINESWEAFCEGVMWQAARAGQAASVPEGFVLMPSELTAENGAKQALSGEFSEDMELECGACDRDDEDCEVCAGHGSYTYRAPVSWPTIKAIYKLAVEELSRPKQEQGQ